MQLQDEKFSSEHRKILKRALIDENLMCRYLNKYSKTSYTKALDIACGSGKTTFLLKQCLKLDEVQGIDIDPDIINYAISINKENIVFQEGNALNLPYESDNFDFTFSRMLFEVCPNVEKILDEAIRVTRDGGRIFFWGNISSTPSIYPPPKYYNKYVEAERKILRATKKLEYNPLELYSLLKKRGLQKIEFVPVVKDINFFVRDELIEYYYEPHDYDNSLLVKLGFFTKTELKEYDISLLDSMKRKDSYYFFLQYYITAIVKK